MKIKNNIYLSILILTLIVLAGCNSETENNEDNQNTEPIEITISTAADTGTYYPLGAAFAKAFNDNADNVDASSQASEGSVQNLNLMAEGTVNAAFTSAGPLYAAYNGEDEFEGRTYKDVRVVSALYPNASHVLTNKDNDIKNLSDFEGESFAVGAQGSVSQEISTWLFEAYDLTFEDIEAEFIDFSGAVDLMRNGRIGGLHYATAVGTSGIMEVMSTADGELINLDEKQLDSIVEEYPMYYKYSIPANSYDGQENEILTLAQNGVFVVSKDMPEDEIYEITKALWDNIDELGETISAVKNMEVESATEDVGDVPLHPGAEKYYKEIGVIE